MRPGDLKGSDFQKGFADTVMISAERNMKNGFMTALVCAVVLFAAVLIGAVPAYSAAAPDLTVEVLTQTSSKGGDAVLVSSAGKYLLMDGFAPEERKNITDQLVKKTGGRLDLYLSHYHHDHYGNFASIIRDRRFKVGKVFLPDPAYIRKYRKSSAEMQKIWNDYQSIVNAANQKKVKIVYLKKGKGFKLGKASVHVFFGPWTTPVTPADHNSLQKYINNASLVTKVTVKGMAYLNCGDLSVLGERQVVRQGVNIKANVFKLNHHGSHYTASDFLSMVKASYFYYQGVAGKYSSKETGWVNYKKRLAEYGELYDPRQHGSIVFSCTDGKMKCKVAKVQKKK